MNRNVLKYGLALLLAVCFVALSVPSVSVLAADNDPVIVIAGSDFQAETSEIGSENVNGILSAIKQAGYETADGFLFAGDYDVDAEDQSEELNKLKETVKTAYPELGEDKMVFVQGNHDAASTKGITPTGASDTENYGVFVINEDDYSLGGGSEANIKSLAKELSGYLEQRISENKTQPVFVVSHLPLHYSYRTINSGDCRYARHLFDVLNEYGEQLNIIFLFGHNHSAPFDDYIGGSAIYLAKGDSIYIAKPGKNAEVPDEYTLNFTYMNAGYVGYTWCLGNQLTMTVFEIDDNTVKVKRYNANGEYDLKIKGDWSSYYDDSAATYGTTASYLNIAYGNPQYIGNSAEDGDVKIYSSGITGLTVTENKNETVKDLQYIYTSYDIKAEGVEQGDTAAVIIDLARGFLDARPIFVRDKNTGEITCHYAKNGILAFETDGLSSYEITQHRNVILSTTDTTVYLAATAFAEGKNYIITSDMSPGTTYALSDTENGTYAAEAEILSGFGSTYIITDDPSLEWTFTPDTEFGYTVSIGTLKNTATDRYLISADGSTLSATETPVAAFGVWRLSSGTYGIYTLSAPDADTRYYMKHRTDFMISETSETACRVFIFEKCQKQVIISAYLDTAFGGVDVGADENTPTGIKLYLLGNDGTEQIIDVTPSMIKTADGKSIDTSSEGEYTELTVYCGDTAVFDKCTLFVGRDVVVPEPESEKEESVDDAFGAQSGDVSDTPSNSGNDGTTVWIWVAVAVIAAAAVTAVVITTVKKKSK